jgi:hypothetical protein
MRLRASVLRFRQRTDVSLSVGRTEFIQEHLSETAGLAEGLPGLAEAGLQIATAITAMSGVPMEIELTSACSPMMMWQECRALTYQRSSYQLMATIIRR